MNLKNILVEIYPLHRTLSSEGTDRALASMGIYMPEGIYHIEEYPALEKVWDWKIPERYIVYDAYLELDGKRIIDFRNNPLHLVSYSLPVNTAIDWNELEPHLYCSADRLDAIPWIYKYYERDWGFCLSKNLFDTLPRDKKYHVYIHSEFNTKIGMRVGAALIDNHSQEEMIICSHICHPNQANDDASGVVTAIELIDRLTVKPLPTGSMNIRFLFCPETIGSIAYLAHHEDLIYKTKGGIFLEMMGNDNVITFHHTMQSNHLLDRITEYVFHRADHYSERVFASAPANDERVINSVGIPCISLNRWPYPEYHTSDDNMDIICEDKLQESADIAEEIIRIFASNYYPKKTYKGIPFLSGSGLWVDWKENWNLNRAIEKMTYIFEGDLSIFDIAIETGLDYWTTREYVEKFREKGLVSKWII